MRTLPSNRPCRMKMNLLLDLTPVSQLFILPLSVPVLTLTAQATRISARQASKGDSTASATTWVNTDVLWQQPGKTWFPSLKHGSPILVPGNPNAVSQQRSPRVHSRPALLLPSVWCLSLTISTAPKSKANRAKANHTLPDIPLSSNEEELALPLKTVKMTANKKLTRFRVANESNSKSRGKAITSSNDSESYVEDDEEDQLALSSEMSSKSSGLEDLEVKNPSAVEAKFAEEVRSTRLCLLFHPSLIPPHRLLVGLTGTLMSLMTMNSTWKTLSPRTSHLPLSLQPSHLSICLFSPLFHHVFYHLLVHLSTCLSVRLCP